MKHVRCEQGSPEWFFARRGYPTASEFNRILTQSTLKLSKSCDDYINELVGEQFSELLPEGVENYTSRAMQWGQETEAEARIYFERTGFRAEKCGFCISDCGRWGCSPDGLVYDDSIADGDKLVGGLELKCPQPKTHIEYLRGDCLPDVYRAQVHGGMIVTGLKQWWFQSYCPGLPSLVVPVTWDVYTDRLMEALVEFDRRYKEILSRIKQKVGS